MFRLGLVQTWARGASPCAPSTCAKPGPTFPVSSTPPPGESPSIIARAGKPVVKVVAVDAPDPGTARRIGFLAGKITAPEDFDRMGAAEIEAMFEGGG